jgi:phage head maturation protease
MENLENIYEVRFAAEITADNEGIVRGRAIVFDSPSEILYERNIGYFIEEIKRGAVTKEFLDQQTIYFKYNHNDNYLPLAYSKNGKGTLRYQVDDKGVTFEFKAKAKGFAALCPYQT